MTKLLAWLAGAKAWIVGAAGIIGGLLVAAFAIYERGKDAGKTEQQIAQDKKAAEAMAEVDRQERGDIVRAHQRALASRVQVQEIDAHVLEDERREPVTPVAAMNETHRALERAIAQELEDSKEHGS